jgi:hypothetical protein
MALISAPSRSLTDRATLWTLAGCIGPALLLARLGAMDYSRSSDLFHPHGYCYLWIPSLVSTHVVSDALIIVLTSSDAGRDIVLAMPSAPTAA